MGVVRHHRATSFLGVGAPNSARRECSPSAGGGQAGKGTLENPQEAAGFGLITADVDAIKVVLGSITDAATTQETKRAHAPLSTKQRNLTANRIMQASSRIAAAGLLAFPSSPLETASFEALMESTKRTKAKKATQPTDAPEVPEVPDGPSSEEPR